MRNKIISLSIVLALIIVAGYAFVYQNSPFSDEWNSFLVNAAAPFAAGLAAIALTAVLLCYNKKDRPYPVWLFFTIGMWVWVVAESIWGYLFFTTGDVPALGLADILWFAGYVTLTVALHS